MTLSRCAWVTEDPLYIAYHDEEWGVPKHDDRLLFEMLTLEGAQAGLSWLTILKRREGYRAAFDNFEPLRVAAYDEARVQALLQDTRIIRNQAKIRSTVQNARAFCEVQAQFGTFAAYLWGFVDGKPIVNHFRTHAELPTRTPISDALSKDLKRRGFTFVGSTMCYALMQSCGLVNDHLVTCFKRTG